MRSSRDPRSLIAVAELAHLPTRGRFDCYVIAVACLPFDENSTRVFNFVDFFRFRWIVACGEMNPR